MKVLLLLLAIYLSIFTAAFAQPNYRLKRVMVERYLTHNNAYNKWDSTEYYYSPGNGGKINNEVFYSKASWHPWYAPNFTGYSGLEHIQFHPGMRYDSAISFQHTHGYKEAEQIKQKLSANSTKMTRYENYTLQTHPSWRFIDTKEYNYNNDTTTRYIWCYNNRCDTFNYTYFYNINGQLDSLTVRRDTVTETTTYSYTNNLLTESRRYASQGIYKAMYVYTGFLLTSTTSFGYNAATTNWDSGSTAVYTYNTNNLLIHRTSKDTSGKTHFTTDYSYDNNNRRMEDILHRDYIEAATAMPVKWIRKRYGYHSSGPINLYQVDVWDDSVKSWVAGNDSILNSAHNVYLDYEMYWPADVSNTVKESSKISLYPSPAINAITITASSIGMGAIEVSIVNMQGQAVRKWKDNASANYTRMVPVEELPSGTYILNIAGEGLREARTFTITK